MAIFRVILYATISPIDLELRRYPVLTLVVRCSVLALTTTTPFLNPLLYLSNRKNLKTSLFVMFPWLREISRLRARRVNVAEAASYSAG